MVANVIMKRRKIGKLFLSIGSNHIVESTSKIVITYNVASIIYFRTLEDDMLQIDIFNGYFGENI